MFSFIESLFERLSPTLAYVRRKRERGKEWSGTVEAKKAQPVSRHAYLVTFRTDDGHRKNLYLDRKEDFDRYEEGRRYTKKAGDDLPAALE